MLSSSLRGVADDEATASTVNHRKRKSSTTSTTEALTEEAQYIALLAQRRRPASQEVCSALSYSALSRPSDETPNHHNANQPHYAYPSGMQRMLQPFGSDTYNNHLPSSASCYESYHEHPLSQADSSSAQQHHTQPTSGGSRPACIVIPPQSEPVTAEQDKNAFERELTLQQDVMELLHPERRYYQGTSMPITGWFHPCRFCRTWTSGCVNFQEDDIAVCKGCEVKLTEYYNSFLQVLLATQQPAPLSTAHVHPPSRPRLARRSCHPSPTITPALPSPSSTTTCYVPLPDVSSSPLPPYRLPALYPAPASLPHKQAPAPSSRLQHVTGPSYPLIPLPPQPSDITRSQDQNPTARPHLKQPRTRPNGSHVSSALPLHAHSSCSLPHHQVMCPSAAADASCVSSYSPALAGAPAPAAAGGRSFSARVSAAAAAAAAAALGGGYLCGARTSVVAADYGPHLTSIERLAAAAAAVGVNVSSYALPSSHSPADLPRGSHAAAAPGGARRAPSLALAVAGQLPVYHTPPFALPVWR